MKVLRPAAEQKADAVLLERGPCGSWPGSAGDAAGDRVFGLLGDADLLALQRWPWRPGEGFSALLRRRAGGWRAAAAGQGRSTSSASACWRATRWSQGQVGSYELMKATTARIASISRRSASPSGTTTRHGRAAAGRLRQPLLDLNEQLAGLIRELRPTSVLPLLEKRLVDAAVPADQRAQIADVVATFLTRRPGADHGAPAHGRRADRGRPRAGGGAPQNVSADTLAEHARLEGAGGGGSSFPAGPAESRLTRWR
ncbi:MAG: hypothetical protein U0736_13965 [Gemmataceae bacterium]